MNFRISIIVKWENESWISDSDVKHTLSNGRNLQICMGTIVYDADVEYLALFINR